MHSVQALFWIQAILAAVVLATPTPNLQKRSFTHVVKRSANKSPQAGTLAIRKAFRKFGFPNPPAAVTNATGTSKAAAASESGSVGANPQQNDAEYLSPVIIGGQTLNMDFDTGSSDLWVFSTKLSAKTIGQHTAFNPTKSTTFQTLQGATWQISYGDGSGAAGTVGTDTVNIGGATATKQAVELATAVSESFVEDTNNDGLVGLAFSSLNTVKPKQQTTFFDTIMSSLAQPIFSVNLKNDSTGTYTFGAIDTTAFTGQLSTVAVDSSNGFWQFNSPTFTVGNQQVANQGGSPAIADTGTSLLLVDPQVAQTYYSQVQGAQNSDQVGGYVYPCSSTLPNFGVAIGPNYTATIPGSQITFAQVDSATCFGGVQSNAGSGLQVYGDVFFRSQYVVFNGQAKTLQLAPKSS